MNKPIQIFETDKCGFKGVGVAIAVIAILYLVPGFAEAYNLHVYMIMLFVPLACMVFFDYSIIVYDNRIETRPMIPLFGNNKLYFKDIKTFQVHEYTQQARSTSFEEKVMDLKFKFKNGKSLTLCPHWHNDKHKLKEILIELLREKYQKNNI